MNRTNYCFITTKKHYIEKDLLEEDFIFHLKTHERVTGSTR